ncbi:MAG: uracil-DNA glycosylase [Alphaproteobacteria bacterium]|nr:MAG: uracil-DNA glycosylase [Alphaproteobacteria bacterium]
MDCGLCPRITAYRAENAARHPDWHNAPVSSFGDPRASLLIVGLAPGRKGANRTGRVFTGDQAGVLLYAKLAEAGWASGRIEDRPDDGLDLDGVMITNALACAPPLNRPLASEIANCRRFLAARIAALPRLRAILSLGRISHDAVLRALDRTPRRFPFAHGARHDLGPFTLFDSYHCSRYNVHTGRLTPAMLADVLMQIRTHLARCLPTRPGNA